MAETEDPPTNAQIMVSYIGRHGLLSMFKHELKGIRAIPVTVTDAKRAYGRLRFQVRPKGPQGLGRTWVNANRVTLDETHGIQDQKR